ncbi:MAG: SPOR domain-containing protein [Ghiorsea sp.]|nr:SPOR domain-containing protein [Ghiorsea sp.]
MLFKSWANTFSVQKIELKVAGALALATACMVLLIVLWSSFFTTTPVKHTTQTDNLTVKTIDAPNLTRQTQQEHADKTPLLSSQQHIKTQVKPSSNKQQANKLKLIKLILGQGNYYVQVGAFSQAKLARLMLGKMRNKYKYAKIKRKTDKHAVWVGPVITKHDAQTLKKHLQRKSNLQGFIVTEK